MPQIIFNEEWVLEKRLAEKTGLTERQIKAYRLGAWIEGRHFKHMTAAGEYSEKGLIWYNYPLINQFVGDFSYGGLSNRRGSA